MPTVSNTLEKGSLSFTIESRIIRELGERLVRQGAIAVLELIKNSYDADALTCSIQVGESEIRVEDDGSGMNLDEFKKGWMRIGTSSKEATPESPIYARPITGEKGIGRFAVRFLGRSLTIETVAFDSKRGFPTLLSAEFDWPRFDREEDLGKVAVPFELSRAPEGRKPGTILTISKLRTAGRSIDFRTIRTGSVGLVSPYLSLFSSESRLTRVGREGRRLKEDPGFALRLEQDDSEDSDVDLGKTILARFVLRATLKVSGKALNLSVWERDADEPFMEISDTLPLDIGEIYSDIRFFPKRTGTFSNIGLDGRTAQSWVKRNSGVAVFDKRFRVHPYGYPGDDWLGLERDTAKNERNWTSSIAKKFFPMSDEIRQSTRLNYMLRLPSSQQLVGIVEVAAARSRDAGPGLIPAADREGFINNRAFQVLSDIVRGSVESLAYVDRQIQLRDEESLTKLRLQQLEAETRQAIEQIEGDRGISKSTRSTLVRNLLHHQELAKTTAADFQSREQTLEVMSLLGVIAGFMTHEFGSAIDDLERAKAIVQKLSVGHPELKAEEKNIESRISNLREFVTYSQGYIKVAGKRPEEFFPARPRILQVKRIFGKYAHDRDISVRIEVDPDVQAPLVPVSLYNGIALNLYTNALKAVTAKTGQGLREICFRAWNHKGTHTLEVSDSGVGLPAILRERIFDPLFTTTSGDKSPLGSGMGLGLTLVRRGVEAFGGKVTAVDPPPDYATCIRVQLPMGGPEE